RALPRSRQAVRSRGIQALTQGRSRAVRRAAATSARWLLPWFCVLLVSTCFAYGVSAALNSAQPTAAEQCEAASPGRSTPALQAERDPQSPAELLARDCDATWIAFAACSEQTPKSTC